MQAAVTLSLGATNPGPPNTLRGTIVNAVAVDAAAPRKARREIPLSRLCDSLEFDISLPSFQRP
jgi:hypothetical protein